VASGLQELGSGGHGVNDELDTFGFGDADLEIWCLRAPAKITGSTPSTCDV
jgi:hypothetical protein